MNESSRYRQLSSPPSRSNDDLSPVKAPFVDRLAVRAGNVFIPTMLPLGLPRLAGSLLAVKFKDWDGQIFSIERRCRNIVGMRTRNVSDDRVLIIL